MTGDDEKLRSAAWFGDQLAPRVCLPRLGQKPRPSRANVRRPARDRDLQYVVGFEPLQCPSADLAEQVKRGVYETGGFPLKFPVNY